MRRPPLDAAGAIRLASENYKFKVQLDEVVELPSYDDRAFALRGHFVGRGDARAILKVFNGEDSAADGFLEAQSEVMAHLVKHGVPTNSIIPSFLGMSMVRLELGGVQHAARLQAYLPGKLWKHAAQTPELYSSLGTIVGRMSVVLLEYDGSRPRGKADWNLCHLPETYARLRTAREAAVSESNRLLLEEAMDQFRAAVGDGSALRQSLIHGDVNEQNLLVNQDETEVVGVLDFGDCSESWLVSEPAIAATYLMLLAFEQDDGRGGAEPIERCAHFLRAYEAEMPLQEAEVAVFRELCLGRLVQSLMMGAISAAENPENAEYTLITARHGWRLLEVLLRYRGFHRLLGRGARTHP